MKTESKFEECSKDILEYLVSLFSSDVTKMNEEISKLEGQIIKRHEVIGEIFEVLDRKHR